MAFGEASQLLTSIKDQAIHEVFQQMEAEQFDDESIERQSIASAFTEHIQQPTNQDL